MRIVVAKPPLFDMINATFNIEGKPVFFAWGDTIFNPMNLKIPPALIAHEEVHQRQQGGKPECWWNYYCLSKVFRLEAEIEAHRAEYNFVLNTHKADDLDKPIKGYRSLREFYLIKIAQKLASPIYNNMISVSDAKRKIAA